jgi:hypothetical protein
MKTTTYEVVWQNADDRRRNDTDHRWNLCSEEDTLEDAQRVRNRRQQYFSNEVVVAIRKVTVETEMIFD